MRFRRDVDLSRLNIGDIKINQRDSMNSHKLSLAAIILLSTTVCATPSQKVNSPEQQAAQIQLSLDQLQQSVKNTTNTRVYLGTTQMSSINLQQQIDANKKLLADIAKQLNKLQSMKTVAAMQWLPITSAQKKNYVNANNAENPVYICRAAFVGSNPGSKAIYPGTLTSQGCRISYAGYAFISASYDVLSGSNATLRWIPIARVNALQPKNPPSKTPVMMPGYDPFDRNVSSFNFDIKIDNKMAVAGGYQGGNPVLICRTVQKDITYVGKLVFFMHEENQKMEMEHACDIGVGDKEVVVGNHYDVLFSS